MAEELSKISSESSSFQLSARDRFASNTKLGFSFVSMMFCCTLVIQEIGLIVTNHMKYEIGTHIGVVVLFAGVLLGCAYIFRAELSKRREIEHLNEEQLVLRMAKKHPSRCFTIPEAMLECQMSLTETAKVFKRLSMQGVCRVDVNNSGEIVYKFPSLTETSAEVSSIDFKYEPEAIE